MASLTLLVSKTFFQVTGTQNFFGKALLGSYLSNKVTNTLTRRVVCILESKMWSNGDFWALRLKINLVQSKSVQKESFGRWLLWLCWSLKIFSQVTETQNFFGKALLRSYLSNKVTNTLTRRVVYILEIKTWSSGDFWALRLKNQPAEPVEKVQNIPLFEMKKIFSSL